MFFRPYIVASAVFFTVLGIVAAVTMGSATDLSLSAYFYDPQVQDFFLAIAAFCRFIRAQAGVVRSLWRRSGMDDRGLAAAQGFPPPTGLGGGGFLHGVVAR